MKKNTRMNFTTPCIWQYMLEVVNHVPSALLNNCDIGSVYVANVSIRILLQHFFCVTKKRKKCPKPQWAKIKL